MGIAVIEKTFLVLEGLAEYENAVSLAKLTERTKLPKPTVYRIVQSLMEIGYVAQDEAARYSLTTKLGGLTRRGEESELKMRALPHMESLYRQFNETVNLGVLDGLGVRYVHILETSRPLRMMVQPNVRDEFYCTAVGRAIAAFLPKAEQDSLVKAAALRPLTPRTVRTKEELREKLAETRARGWAIDDEETVMGVICFAVPLVVGGRPVAAISITMPNTRLTPDLREAVLNSLLAVEFDRRPPAGDTDK